MKCVWGGGGGLGGRGRRAAVLPLRVLFQLPSSKSRCACRLQPDRTPVGGASRHTKPRLRTALACMQRALVPGPARTTPPHPTLSIWTPTHPRAHPLPLPSALQMPLSTLMRYGDLLVEEQENVKRVQLADEYLSGGWGGGGGGGGGCC